MDIEIKNMLISDLENIKKNLTTDFDDFWTYDVFKDELLSKNSKYIIGLIDSEIVGFAGVKIVDDQADIMNIVVKKSCRKKGIGFILLNELINICTNLNVSSIFLEVNENNLPAISLYKKIGFEQVGYRKNYYHNDSGILFSFNIKYAFPNKTMES